MQKIFTLLFTLLFSVIVNAQSSANYAFTTSSTASLTDMNSGTTPLVAASQDDIVSSITNIGFEFWFMGVRYTQFSASSNGYIRLGTTAVSTTQYTLGTAGAALITAFGSDLITSATGKVHYKIIGSAPNRTLVIEFKDMNIIYAATPTADGTYQVRLSETSNVIQFVYGTMKRNSSTGYQNGMNAQFIGFSTNATSNTFATYVTASGVLTTSGAPTFQQYALNAPIADLTSAADGARKMFTFTPAANTAPTALNFTAVTTTGMTLNWTDNSADEIAFAIYRSDDGGTTYNFITQTAANTTSSVQTGLVPSTNYFWKVYAVREIPSSAVTGSNATSTLVNFTSNGTGGGLWSATTTWTGGVVPTIYDAVTIKNGDAVIINTAAAAYNLTVGQGVSGSLSFDATTARTLTVQNNVTIAAGGSFQTASTGAITSHSASIGGSLTNNGTFDFSTNANTAGADLIFTGIANNTLSGSGGITDIRTLTVNKGTSSTSIFELNPVNFTVQGSTADGAPMAFLTLTNGTFKVSGSFTMSSRVFTAAAYSIPATCGFWLNNPNFTVSGQAGSSTVSGMFRITQGNFNIGSAADNSMAFNAGSEITIEGGFVFATGRFGVGAAVTAFTYTQTNGTVTVCTIGNSSTTLASFDAGTSLSSLISISGGTIVCQLANTSGAGPRDYRHQAGSKGITDITGGTLQLGNASSGAAKAFTILGVVPNLILTNTSAGHSVVWGTNPVNFNNSSRNLTINTGTTLNLGNNTFDFYGTTLTNNGTLTHTGSSSNFYLLLTTAAQLYTGSGTATITNINIQTGISFTIDPASPNIVAETVRLISGNVINSNKLTVGNGGATTAQVQIGSNPNISVTPTAAGTFDQQLVFNPGTGGIDLSYLRTTTSRTTGGEVPATRSITNLTYDDNDPTHNLTIAGGNLTLSSSASTLALNNGRMITGANSIILSSGTATVTRNTGYIDGNFRKSFAAASSKVFEVGTANTYSPVTVNATAGTFPADFTVKAVQGTHTGLNPALSLQRYWTLTGTGITADLTFHYVGFYDVPLTATEANFLIYKYNGTSYTQPGGTVNVATNTATITGVTSFSDWTLAQTSAILPINLLTFSGYKESSHNVLGWTTTNERNNRGFEIQRSTDGANYSSIGFVNSQAISGNSLNDLHYTFTDINPAGAKQYYRLRQVDIDNNSKYSSIVLIRGDKPLTLAIGGLFPNPAKSIMNVIIDAPVRSNLLLVVTDIAGKIVKQQASNVEAGSNNITISVNDLSNGIYTVKAISIASGESAVSKFIKQ